MQNSIANTEPKEYVEAIEDSLLDILLADRTTGLHIVWGTEDYAEFGDEYKADQEIKLALITGQYEGIIQPRTLKEHKWQQGRTREKAEVFTPSWVCNAQNNLVDDAWFKREAVFNVTDGHSWKSTEGKIEFGKDSDRTWQDYVTANRLEITCGEAPYLVSRYDTVTGDLIPIEQRIGLLDRKLRIVNEHTETEEEWVEWAKKAVQSIYGYELQGDNLLLARKNIFLTCCEYFEHRFHHKMDTKLLTEIATIISWNLWQMDGLNFTVPYCKLPPDTEQMGLFPVENSLESDGAKSSKEIYSFKLCKIKDWDTGETPTFKSLMKGA